MSSIARARSMDPARKTSRWPPGIVLIWIDRTSFSHPNDRPAVSSVFRLSTDRTSVRSMSSGVGSYARQAAKLDAMTRRSDAMLLRRFEFTMPCKASGNTF